MRISPATPPFADEIRKPLEAVMPEGVAPLTLFTTLARNPRVFERVMRGGLLDRGSLTLRQREVMIARTTARCGAEYEWGVHIAFFAQRVGFDAAQIEALATGHARAPVWVDEADQLIIEMADALHDTASVDDALWARLSAAFSDEQLIELTVLCGFYHMISFCCGAFALPREAYAAPLPDPQQHTQDG